MSTLFPSHSSIWWQSAIKVDGERFIPQPPFTPYNPFDWYFPIERATREQQSLPYRFLDVDGDDTQAVARFCERFGVLGDFRNVGWGQWATAINPLASTITEGLPPAQAQEALSKSNFYRASAGTRPNPTLCVPMELDQFRQAQRELYESIVYAQRAPGNQPETLLLPDENISSGLSLKEIRYRASFTMASRLSMVRPRPVWDTVHEQWVTVWDVLTLEAAMYLMVLFDIQGRGNILACPRCGKIFVGDRPRTQFCSPQCQNAAKVQRFRTRMAEKETNGGTDHD